MMRRREMLGGLSMAALMAGLPVSPAEAQPLMPLWEAWTTAFLEPNGRVVDEPQRGASHSEGQAYGMILAEAMGDEASFRRILNWTAQHLWVRPDDMLMAWRWLPESQSAPDLNNASDGDLLAAWALHRAASRFSDPSLDALARALVQDFVRLCVTDCPWREGRLVMRPGVVGFEHDQAITQNLSYYVFPAIKALSALDSNGRLAALHEDGVDLVSRTSISGLPPDWLRLSPDGWGEAPDMSAMFGYDAMRVPLNLVWGGLGTHEVVQSAAQIYAGFLASGQVPTRIDPATLEVVEVSADPGYGALASVSLCAQQSMSPEWPVPAFATAQPYYPASLHLLSLLAQSDANLSCFST